MRVTDRLIRDTERKRKTGFFEEEEETFTYLERKKQFNINENPGISMQKNMEGINTRASIFDQQAVFHTKEMRKDTDGNHGLI